MDTSTPAVTLTFEVTAADTAAAVGSGDLPVLSTPGLLAWAEAATCAALAGTIGAGQTSVGSRVTLEHRAASLVGERVDVTATLIHRDGRLCRFEVAAVNSTEVVVGHGEITRIVVERDGFMARVRR
ncbi:MAG: hypothetical protein AVDCRST_MAG34-296 [uncultured Nocardioidaceae bacterium]|uniref:Fluoroacetyl-CoA-specific thioesterase-like domain-containing protein n=1 Tax=uncultured Nocardioidaceae bacterium TaxID=253824 RepID=A0A6J4L7X0_9ACTN|nr:MAG: hypothetical protein AVDCRST_MAG34-296 [uncultured Nocardioidaceae bacterium]